MRVTLLTAICFALLIHGCAPSKQDEKAGSEYPDLVQINMPGDIDQEKSQVYIDEVKKIWEEEKQALLIKGTFPDACSHIGSATHSEHAGTIGIKIVGWREVNTMCAQVLTSFSFIYRQIPDSVLENTKEVVVNNQTYKIP